MRVRDAAGADVGWEAASGAQSSKAEVWGGPLTGRARWEPTLHEQCWRFAEEEKGSGTEGVDGNSGISCATRGARKRLQVL